MNPEVPQRATAEGMNPLTKDRFDVASKTVAIIGGLISASVPILTLQASIDQRARELRWNQARLATELVGGMLSDPQAFNALRMTDWTRYEYKIEEKNVVITSEEVQEALKVENNNKLPPNGVFIRESFDRLFYHMGIIQRALKSELVRLEDVRSPMDYYIPFLRSTYGEILIPYMEQLHHNDALNLMNNLSPISAG
jgi:hypothetical protein